ncbi:hypothetical protein J4G52_05635 [Burkholderia cenocepacia]|uniref:hypothetical protein n=1 Tax=Pseudomonadota TaxID=1224 RepID=UPI001AA16955|nr:hypothetical protein [Burkholderia cenocepacia]MBO1853031.1 hypothetical protein [Burkholderia cenocepacia]
MSPTLSLAQHLALAATGLFFLNGLLTGVWKYAQMRGGDHAHYYVNIAHRTSLMYAFACLLLERFAALSAWSAPVNTAAVIASVAFFAMAVVTYMVHGFLGDTENQLERPHKLGRATLPNLLITGFMVALILAEIGGFLVLLAGAGRGLGWF